MTLHQERWEKAQELFGKELYRSIAIDDATISAKFTMGEKEYACYLDESEFFCSCTDHATRKVMCKHLLGLLLEVKGKIPKERYQKYIKRVEMPKVPEK